MGGLQRFLGGPPAVVLLKLLFLSLLVGIVMAGLGLTPGVLIANLAVAAHAFFGLGLDTVRDLGRYVAYGAAIVVPLWFLTRLAQSRN